MPAPTEDTNLADLERQRRELEDNVRKLQQSLYHWRLWEAEYDGLKEELASLREDATRDELLDKGREFGGSVVTEDEVRDLLGLKKQSQKQSSASVPSASRSRDQVVQLIARRIDYVRQNVATMEKRLQAAEDRLNELLGVTAERPRDVAAAASKGGGGDDDGGAYPVTEIVEELDEEGNVIKGTTTKPGEQAPELLEVLKKAGVMQISDRITEKAKAVEQKHKQGQEKQQEKEGSKPAAAEKEVSTPEPKKEPEQKPKMGPEPPPKLAEKGPKPQPKPAPKQEAKQEPKQVSKQELKQPKPEPKKEPEQKPILGPEPPPKPLEKKTTRKPEPKPAEKKEPQPHPKPESKQEPKQGPEQGPEPEPKPEPKPETKKEPQELKKQDPKQEPKPEPKQAPKPEPKPAAKQEQKPEKPVAIQVGGAPKQPEKTVSPHVNGAAHPTAAAKPEKAEDVRPVTDVDESPEDAKLRREMLQYGLNEVGAIVAELELDENASEFSITDEEYDSYEDVDHDDESESEDEYGRTTRRVLTDEIHQQMRELERKLNARGMLNIGRDTTSLPEEVRRELEEPRVDRVEKSEASQEAEKAEKGDKSDKAEAAETAEKAEQVGQAEKAPETKPKKKVAFAPELDIAPDPEPPAAEKKTRPRKPETPAVSDTIVERTEAVKEEKRAEERKPPKKVSRFKSARAAGTPTAETITTTPAPTASTTKPPTVRSSVGQPDPSSLPLFPAKPKEPKPFSQPIAADIIENDTLSSSSRSRSRPSEPRPPEGKILADNLVEREVSEGSAAPPDPDELDEELHRKEIATEFHRMRNRMIHRSGGYLNDDERETVPLDEDEDEDQTADGQPKRRVSRFKAARMR